VTVAGLLGGGAEVTFAAPAQDQGDTPAFTPDCAVPENDIANPAPLPHLISRLQRRATIRILAIGSSSTYGTGASSEIASYPNRLRPILVKALKGIDIVITSRGIAGEMADTTADRIMNEVALSKPDLVLWQLGTNDALARVPPQEFGVTVRETIRWLRSQNIDVVLVGLQYVPRYSRDPAYLAIRQELRTIATEEKILYVRRYEAMRFIEQMRAKEQIMSADQFHLNDLGYRCMAEHVARAVIISLFSKPAHPPNH
jgi:acyl-CoA thioesterase I